MRAAGDPVRLMRWSRWGILCAALLMGSGMVLSAWSNHSRVQELSWTLIRGQSHLLLEGVRQGIGALPRPPGPEELARLLDSLRDQGMSYLAMPIPVLSEAGTALGGPPRIEPLAEGAPTEVLMEEIGTHIRVVYRAPSPPPRPGTDPRPWVGHDGPPSRPRPRRGAPPMIFEFEPLSARELVSGSRRSLLVSAGTAVALLLGALAAFRWLKGREALEARLARERHLASLGEMSAVLAHEIRNPLASLKGHAQLLTETLPEGRSRAKAERVVKEAVRLEELTTGLLAFVRMGTIHRQETDPVAIVRAAAGEVSPERIEVDDGAAPRSWSLDAARMQQVLSNLLRNAVQASPADAPVSVRVAAEGSVLLYEVRDAGTGIEPGKETVIFEPFHTSRPLGTGLGLAVARRVVEHHGGTIQASNRPEGGALFRVRIPLAA